MKTKNILIVCFVLISAFAYSQNCGSKSTTKDCKTTAKINEALFNAAEKGNLDKVKYFIEEKCIDVNQPLKNKQTALHIVSRNGHTDLVKYLLKKGANIQVKNKWNDAPIHLASTNGHVEAIQLLIDNGAETSSIGGGNFTALHKACWRQKPEAVKVLLKNGVDANLADGDGEPPIIIASWMGNEKILRLLIENGANVDACANDKSSVLHILAQRNNHKGISLVLENKGDANVINNEGMLPLHYAVKNKHAKSSTLLLQLTTDINIQDKISGNTVLHLAAINGDTKISSTLLNNGANANIKNQNKQIPLNYAKKYGYTELVELYASKRLANKKNIKATKLSRNLINTDLSYGEAQIVYTGHSGYIIKTKDKVLVFDYWSNSQRNEPSLANGSFCCDEMKDKEVYVFVSHEHGDHYDTIIYSWADKVKDINYVFGFDPEKSDSDQREKPEYTFVKNNTTKQVNKVKVTSIKSNDSGQGFLVEANGVAIYHPGDHAWFSKEDEAGFKKEVDFLATINNQVDIAFLPVTGCPVRWQKKFIVDGFFYNIEKLNPKQVYPVHAFGREHVLKEFEQFAKDRNVSTKIICAENLGDNYQYTNKAIANK